MRKLEPEERMRRLRARNHAYYLANKEHIRAGRRIRYHNVSKVREYYIQRGFEMRLESLRHYGGDPPSCACCGENELHFLSIDHLNGNGGKHRKQVGSGNAFHYWLRRSGYPDGFQVLCHNCNMAKGFYGECPHMRIGGDT